MERKKKALCPAGPLTPLSQQLNPRNSPGCTPGATGELELPKAGGTATPSPLCPQGGTPSAWAGAGVLPGQGCSQGSCSPCSGKSCFPHRRNMIQQAEHGRMWDCRMVLPALPSPCTASGTAPGTALPRPSWAPASGPGSIVQTKARALLPLSSGAAKGSKSPPGPLCSAPLRSSLWLPAQPPPCTPSPNCIHSSLSPRKPGTVRLELTGHWHTAASDPRLSPPTPELCRASNTKLGASRDGRCSLGALSLSLANAAADPCG